MKPMVWKPEEHDHKINAYLDQINHAPYELIVALMLGGLCLFTLIVVIGVF